MFGHAVALCGATLYVGAPHGGGGGGGGEHASGSPGCVQYAHVDEDGESALKEQDAGILWQCVRGRAGVSLPENVFNRAARKVLRDKGAPWPLVKIMMIGEGRAGKTALRNALLGKPFVETNSTIGIETLTVGRLAITGTGQGQWVEGMEVEVDGVESEMRERAVAKNCVIEMHESTQVAAPGGGGEGGGGRGSVAIRYETGGGIHAVLRRGARGTGYGNLGLWRAACVLYFVPPLFDRVWDVSAHVLHGKAGPFGGCR